MSVDPQAPTIFDAPKPTGAQARAADPDRSVWATANAGTGKTRVLSDRVLRLLLDGAHPESILCITFTKAAAVEMTERVEKALADWATETDDERLSTRITALTGSVPAPERLGEARRLFARVLDLPHGLSIQTIHAFCAGLLRRFPVEAGIPPHFETLDDRSAAEMRHDARARLLGPLRLDDERLAAAISTLTAVMAEASLSELLGEILGKRDAIEAAMAGGLDELIERVHEMLDVPQGIDPAALERAACADGVMDVHRLRGAVDALLTGSKTDIARGEMIAVWLELRPEDRVTMLGNYRAQFLTQKGEPAKRLITNKSMEAHPGAFEALRAEQTRLVRLADQLEAAQIAHRTTALLTVAQTLTRDYRAAKERAAALDFADLITKAVTLLASAEQRQWVLYKLDARIEHILVDEAQDTSPAQWAVILALVEELAAGKGAHDRPRTLFVVGDEKQSIYGFQGADLANFQRVRQEILSRTGANEERLETSFRNSGAVLDVVDAVIAQPDVKDGVVVGDAEVRHVSSRPNDLGEVTLWPLEPPPPASEEREPWALPDASHWRPSAEERLAGKLARQIERWLSEDEPLPSTGMPPRPSDVLVLVSRRGRIQELVISALKRRGVPVAGADRLGLTTHLAVQDLMALARFLLLPEDDLSLACLLKSPLLGIEEDELFEIAHGRGKRSLLESLRSKRAQFGAVLDRLEGWLDRADFTPPYELFSGILAEGGRRRMLERLGPDAEEPMEAFLGQALAYEQGHPASLESFLHWLTADESSLKRDPAAARDEVRVMTVHGAKGLEAPIVVLADAGPRTRRNTDKIIIDPTTGVPFWRGNQQERDPVTEKMVEHRDREQELEQSRLLYVALTRAKDRLLVTGWLGRNSKEDTPCWHKSLGDALSTLGADPAKDNSLVYRRGTSVPSVPTEIVETKRLTAPPPQPAWITATPPPEPPKPRPLAASGPTSDEPAVPSPLTGMGPMRDYGITVHRLLHQLAGLAKAQRAPHLAQLDPAMAREIENVLDMPELAAAFGPDSLAEQPIAGRIGDVLVSGQIDRMAVLEDRVLVVDFKTHRWPPATPERVDRSHLKQLAAYVALLERIFPGKRVTAALVWTAVPQLMLIPEALLRCRFDQDENEHSMPDDASA